MSLPAWVSLAALCALGAMSPGPSLAVVLHHALRGSRAAGLACALAHATGVGLYALVTALGLAAFLTRHQELYRLVVLAGATYLAWLGLRLLLERGAALPRRTAARPPEIAAAARDGFLTALFNPKIALFFLAIFSQFTGSQPGAGTVVVLTGTAALIDGTWYALVVLAASCLRLPGGLQARASGYNRVMGGILVLVAVWVLLQPG